MVKRRSAACCLLLGAATIVGGCGISDASGVDVASARLDGTEAVAESNNAAIEIRRFVFVSPQAELSGSDDLRIVNADGVAHEIVADDGSFETGRIEPGDSATVQTPNGITFHCVIHPNMTGQT